MLRWLAAGRAMGFLPRGRVAGLAFEATDVECAPGPGPAAVRGPALALSGALCGRAAWLDDLSGEGLATLSSRL